MAVVDVLNLSEVTTGDEAAHAIRGLIRDVEQRSLAIGRILQKVRDEELWSATAISFVDWVAKAIGVGSAQAYRLIDHAAATDVLSPEGETLELTTHQSREIAPVLKRIGPDAARAMYARAARSRAGPTPERLAKLRQRTLERHAETHRSAASDTGATSTTTTTTTTSTRLRRRRLPASAQERQACVIDALDLKKRWERRSLIDHCDAQFDMSARQTNDALRQLLKFGIAEDIGGYEVRLSDPVTRTLAILESVGRLEADALPTGAVGKRGRS